MITVVGNKALDADEADARQKKAQVQESLASYVRGLWVIARNGKSEVEKRLEKSRDQRIGEYSNAKMSELKKANLPATFMRETDVKCRSAEAWLRDVMTASGDKLWSLKPTPKAEMPEELMTMLKMRVSALNQQDLEIDAEKVLKKLAQQEAQDRAEKMERVIHDQMIEGGWDRAFRQFLNDFVTFPSAFIKAPVLRNRKKFQWANDWTPKVESVVSIEFERVSPFDIYPEPGIEHIEDGYIFQRHRMTRSNLTALIGVKSYSESAIRGALKDYHSGGLSDWISADSLIRPSTESVGLPMKSNVIDALEFWGSVPGQFLIDWGMDGCKIDPHREYQATVWLVGSHIIQASLNVDPLHRKPYSKASFNALPGSFWGQSIPEMMVDVQDVCNSCVRALIRNMSMSSGVLAEVDIDRIPPGDLGTAHVIHPLKVFRVRSDKVGGGQPAVRFHNVPSNANELMSVYKEFSRLADEHTGIPAYTYGVGSAQGAGRTASGLSMLMTSAARGIKMSISNIDILIQKVVERMYWHNMVFHPDADIKGDVYPVARGSSSLIAKEQVQMRRSEFLAQTANPLDSEIMGIHGRAAVLRETAKSLDMPQDEIVPSKEELDQREQMAQQQALELQQMEAQGQPAQQALDGSKAGGGDARIV